MRTIALLLVAALASAAPALAWTEALVLTTDFATVGGASSFLKDSPWTVTPDRETIGADAVARYHGGYYYVIDRSGSNLQILDPATGCSTVAQFTLGTGRNPQDIAFAPNGTAYIDCYDTAELLHVDIAAESILEVISTAAFADADSIPETGWMLAVDDLLFINLQRIDRDNWWMPAGGSGVLVYDMAGGDWVDCDEATEGIQPIDLYCENPATQLELSADRSLLRVGCIGNYGAQDGGVEQLSVDDLVSWGLEMSEADLGGDLLDFESSGDLCYVIISGAAYDTSVRWYDRTTLDLGVLDQSTGYDHSDIAVADGLLYLADRTYGNEGLRVFDALARTELTTSSLSTGLPPFMICLPIDESLSGVDPLLPPAQVALAAPWPNPANPATNIRCTAPAGSIVRLTVHDLRGALLRRVVVEVGAEGRAEWRFDGRDEIGRAVASGTYLVRAEGHTSTATTKLSLIR